MVFASKILSVHLYNSFKNKNYTDYTEEWIKLILIDISLLTHPKRWGYSSSLFCQQHWWPHTNTCLNPAPGRCQPNIQSHSQSGDMRNRDQHTVLVWISRRALSTLPSVETVRPGLLKSGRPSLRHESVGGGIASLWQCSTTGPPSITVAFSSSPLMLGGTAKDTRITSNIFRSKDPDSF